MKVTPEQAQAWKREYEAGNGDLDIQAGYAAAGLKIAAETVSHAIKSAGAQMRKPGGGHKGRVYTAQALEAKRLESGR